MIRLYYRTLLSPGDGSAAGRALLLTACAEYGVDYGAEPRYKNGYGKEYFKNAPLYYNVSHTKNLVCAAISASEIGVDCETVRDLPDHLHIAKRFFTESEFESVRQSDTPLQTFFALWTKKESYVKYLGKGFAVPLSSFDIKDIENIQKTFEINGAFVTLTGDNASDTIFINGDTL